MTHVSLDARVRQKLGLLTWLAFPGPAIVVPASGERLGAVRWVEIHMGDRFEIGTDRAWIVRSRPTDPDYVQWQRSRAKDRRASSWEPAEERIDLGPIVQSERKLGPDHTRYLGVHFTTPLRAQAGIQFSVRDLVIYAMGGRDSVFLTQQVSIFAVLEYEDRRTNVWASPDDGGRWAGPEMGTTVQDSYQQMRAERGRWGL